MSKRTLETERTKNCPVLQSYARQGVVNTNLSAKLKAKRLPVLFRNTTKKRICSTNNCEINFCVYEYIQTFLKKHRAEIGFFIFGPSRPLTLPAFPSFSPRTLQGSFAFQFFICNEACSRLASSEFPQPGVHLIQFASVSVILSRVCSTKRKLCGLNFRRPTFKTAPAMMNSRMNSRMLAAADKVSYKRCSAKYISTESNMKDRIRHWPGSRFI